MKLSRRDLLESYIDFIFLKNIDTESKEKEMHPDWQRICNDFLQATSYSIEGWEQHWEGRNYDPNNRPETYLTYPNAKEIIPLGKPVFPQHTNLWATFQNRRSKRNFIDVPMTLNELNILLWCSQGITADMGNYQLRTAPSSGAGGAATVPRGSQHSQSNIVTGNTL